MFNVPTGGLVISAFAGGAAEMVMQAIAKDGVNNCKLARVGFLPWTEVAYGVFTAEGTLRLVDGKVLDLKTLLVIGAKAETGVHLQDQHLLRNKPFSISRAYGCLSGNPPYVVRINPTIKACHIHRAANEICALLVKHHKDDFASVRAENAKFQTARLARARAYQEAYVNKVLVPYEEEEIWCRDMTGIRQG